MMKILYAIQGTGNGHVSRAVDVVPILKKKVETDVLISGIQSGISLPFEVKYQLHGMGFIFGKSGGINYWQTLTRNNPLKTIEEIRSLPVEEYDLIINDFEPISAWAARVKKVPCISVSHQSAVIHPLAPKPNFNDPLGKFILKHYAPAKHNYGFHFKAFGESIFTPVIRKDIRNETPVNSGHYTVYLPAYSDQKIIRCLSHFGDLKWHVFSKNKETEYEEGNVLVKPVNLKEFNKSLISCEGVLCGAGFETPAEALYLGKKLLVIPMHRQYEQHCNAAALKKIGIRVIPKLGDSALFEIADWLSDHHRVKVDYSDHLESILNRVLDKHLFRKTMNINAILPSEEPPMSSLVTNTG